MLNNNNLSLNNNNLSLNNNYLTFINIILSFFNKYVQFNIRKQTFYKISKQMLNHIRWTVFFLFPEKIICTSISIDKPHCLCSTYTIDTQLSI